MCMTSLSTLLHGIVEVPSVFDVTIHGLQTDSRRVAMGDAFVALPGSGTPADHYMNAAIKAGAIVVILDSAEPRPCYEHHGALIVPVRDLKARLGRIAAATGCRLDHDGKADFVGDLQALFLIIDLALGAGRGGDLVLDRQLLARDLVAQQLHRLDRRADELDVAGAADLGEVGVLRQESVTGVDGVDVGDLGGGDDAGDVEIAVGRPGGADADRLVRQADVGGIAVGGGIDGDGLDPELVGSTKDPQRYLPAVGDQYLLEHARSPRLAASQATMPCSCRRPPRAPAL